MSINVATPFRLPLPIAMPWVSGRFYDSSLAIVSYATGLTKNLIFAEPILIPSAVTVTALGVETTIAASAGSLGRLAIYDMYEDNWYPHNLIKDAGTIALDAAAGFQSASLSLVLEAGWYWMCLAQDNPTTGATYRTLPSSAGIHALSIGTVDLPANTSITSIQYAAVGPQVVNAGFPSVFYKIEISTSQALVGSQSAIPRLMLGI